MRNGLLIALLAIIGMGRIDLLGGSGPFLLTPFLVLAPVLALVEIGRATIYPGEFRLPPNSSRYFLIVSTLLAVVLLSVFAGYDVGIAAKRFSLLAVQIYLTLLLAISLASRQDFTRILLRGAYYGLGLCLIFNLVQIVAWFAGVSGESEPSSFIAIAPGSYYGIIPRLTGVSHDPNLGGSLILVYLYVIWTLARPSRARNVLIGLGIASLLLTLSRSVMIASLGVAIFALMRGRQLRIHPIWALTGGMIVSAALVVALLLPGSLDAPAETLGVLGNRVSVSEGSSGQHVAVLSRGWEVATANVKQTLLGIGYGNAYIALQEIFPGNRYGNFHSLFITFLAESGVVAALIMLGLFAYPLGQRNFYQPLILGFLLYNLFQQSQTDPMFWFILALAWLKVAGSAGIEEARERWRPATVAV